MSEVKWIKICTNMINNKKIKRIRKMPEGNNIVLIWVFMLALAGDCNKNGALFFTDTIPYTPEDLAIEFDFDISVIKLALLTLEKYSMVEVFDDIFVIKNWDEYQNIDGLDKIRHQARLRQQRYRSKQKLLTTGNVTCNVTVTQSNAIEEEREKELEEEIEVKDYTLEIKNFRQRYDSDTLTIIDTYFDILKTTRVSGKISDSIVYKVYKEMNKHPPIVVKYSCTTVVNKPDLHSKRETYFYGIMRNTTADEADRKLKGSSKQSEKSKYKDLTNYVPGE